MTSNFTSIDEQEVWQMRMREVTFDCLSKN